MTAYDAVLFDNDGVLVEPPSIDTLREAARSAFEAVGIDDAEESHVEDVMYGVTPDLLRDVCGAYGVDRETFWAARDRLASKGQRAEFEDGVRDCYDDVVALANFDHYFGIVSSNQHETIEFILEFFEFGDLFETYYGREATIESVARKKPEPYYLERALADIGADPDRALYVGDSESDVEAARRAGMDSAFVRRAHRADLELSVEPTYEVADLHDVERIANGERTTAKK
ncbi:MULTISPECIES: HAD family hydrolase [Halorussus]|uniref:HAD family hydrolase n=1 Tax=Halorussus TaxID=1070314 RepID=UPI0020A220CB|nr:HAD family hydrolase [Halorussus vallis]USZ75518.1 HAD family hydrolase [Halorussus vallis]